MGDSLAPLQIFNALLHSAFSAASKLRITVHDIRRMLFFITGLASFSYLVLKHLGRLTSSTSLKGRAPKAKSSMVASAIPQNLRLIFKKWGRSYFSQYTWNYSWKCRLEGAIINMELYLFQKNRTVPFFSQEFEDYAEKDIDKVVT